MRILIVCFPESPHSQSWIDLFDDDKEFDVRVFAHNFVNPEDYLPQEWKKPTYTVEPPTRPRKNAGIFSLFPESKYARFVSKRVSYRLPLTDWYLKKIIEKWKPDIVHSLTLLPTADFTWRILRGIKKNRPLFVVSSWGSDIYLGKNSTVERPLIKEVLANCDGFISDCKRDIDNALELGLPRKKLAFDFAVPVNGGLIVDNDFNAVPVEQRNIILVPKAVEAFANKTLAVLEALHTVSAELDKYEIHLLLTSEDVKKYLLLMPENFRNLFHIHFQLRHEEVLNLMRRSRIMIAPSVSDGTPIGLLEAMAAGVLPIVSPLESIREWITDGKNGLLAHALYPNEIARCLKRALRYDELCRSAMVINKQIITEKANRQVIKRQVMNYYKNLMIGGEFG